MPFSLSFGHIFWFLGGEKLRTKLREKGIKAASHYEAAHLTPIGKKYGKVISTVSVSQEVADSIIRLPTEVSQEEARRIVQTVNGELA